MDKIKIVKKDIIDKGAEATIYRGTFLDIPAIFKHRVPKKYRIKEIDQQIRSRRIKSEAKITVSLRNSGVRVPALLATDINTYELIFEFVDGILLHTMVDTLNLKELEVIFVNLGKEIAKIHKNNVVHGDLTVFNVIVKDQQPWIIDFGLGMFTDEIEKKADDLLTFQNTLKAITQNEHILIEYFFKGYEEVILDTHLIKSFMTKIASRARYIDKKDRFY